MLLDGLTTMATASEGIQICVFDLRRGQHEGQEVDKILFFFPSDCPCTMQLSVVGLCEGLITFTRIFSPEAACEVIEAERHSHVFYQAESDIWMVMVLDKTKDNESVWRSEDFRGILKEIHSLFVMFHGSLRALLEKQPSGELARSYLYSFVMDYLTDFQVGKKLQMASFQGCLRERGTLQMLTVSQEVALEVQSLITVLSSICGGSTVCNSLVLFQNLLVSTTLCPDDTVNLFTYSTLRLTPRSLSSGISSWSYLRKGTSAPNVAVSCNITNAGEGSLQTSRDTSPRGQEVFRIPRPLQHDKWSKGKDSFLVSDIWGAEVGDLTPMIPTVWLQQMEEWMYLCVYQHKSLTIVLLIPVFSLMNGEQGMALIKQQLLEKASQKILNIEEKLSRGWGGENAYHVKGYRYLLIDNDRSISRASPPGKVMTLTKGSLLALDKLREEVDLEKKRSRGDSADRVKDLEVCIRAKNNAWLIAKIARGRVLYMVLEKAGETLLYASEALEKFSSRYCEGAFSLD